MKSIQTSVFILALCAACVLGCDQTMAEFPDAGSFRGGSQCGPWYPGSGVDAGEETKYAIAEGATFPCLVWESARVNHEDAWLSAGDLYLEVKHGALNAKALVIAYVGVGCSGCQELIGAMAKRKDDLDAVAVMVGMSHDIFSDEPLLSLDRAEQVLIETDGWPAAWLVTNDAEKHMPVEEYPGIPWIVIVKLSDMEVVERNNSTYNYENVDKLVEFVSGL